MDLTQDSKITKYRHTLYISGYGVMIFGIWSIVRVFVYLLLTPEDTLTILGLSGESGLVLVLTFFFTAILLLIDLSLRLRVGLYAVRKSRAREPGFAEHAQRRKKAPFFSLFLLILGSVLGTFLTVFFIVWPGTSGIKASETDTLPSSTLVDLTALYILIDLAVASWRLNKAETKSGSGAGSRHTAAGTGTATDSSGSEKDRRLAGRRRGRAEEKTVNREE